MGSEWPPIARIVFRRQLYPTTRWTGAAVACFASNLVRRRVREIAPPGQLGGSQSILENPNHAWLDQASYYTEIGSQSTDPVTVFDIADQKEVSSDKPGTPCLHLEPRYRFVQVRDVEGREQGVIRSEGIVPTVRYVMRRSGDPLWTLTVRSIVRKRHQLERSVGEKWTFDTPFFWWQDLKGTIAGIPRLFGRVGPTKRLWFIWVEPSWATPDLLAAVALLHRNWWRW